MATFGELKSITICFARAGIGTLEEHVAELVEQAIALVVVARDRREGIAQARAIQRVQTGLLVQVERAALRPLLFVRIAFEHARGDAMDVQDARQREAAGTTADNGDMGLDRKSVV